MKKLSLCWGLLASMAFAMLASTSVFAGQESLSRNANVTVVAVGEGGEMGGCGGCRINDNPNEQNDPYIENDNSSGKERD